MFQRGSSERATRPVVNGNDTHAPPFLYQTPVSQPSHMSRIFKSTVTNSPLAGQGEVQLPLNDSSQPPNLTESSEGVKVLTPKAHETFGSANHTSNRFQSVRRFAFRILERLLARSRRNSPGATPLPSSLTQTGDHPHEAKDELSTGHANAGTISGSISSATLVSSDTLQVADRLCDTERYLPKSTDNPSSSSICGPSSTPALWESPPHSLQSLARRTRGPQYELSGSSSPILNITSTDEPNNREQNLWWQWAQLPAASGVQVCGEHKIIATAIVLYDWDGLIPGRQTRGCPLKEGERIQICNVIDENWLHSHVNGLDCMYIPRPFVDIERFENERSGGLIGNSTRVTKIPAGTRNSILPFPWFLVSTLLAPFRRDPDVRKPLEHLVEKKQRPDIPPAPFSREPSDIDHKGNRVLVDTDCKYFEDFGGVIVTFALTLVPALQSRFTNLWLNVKLPNGQEVVKIHPEHVVRQQTNVQRNFSRNKELAPKASISTNGVGAKLEYEESHAQIAEHPRIIKAEILGAGTNSDNATWTASEDPVSHSGLETKMMFSIMLQTRTPPAKITCQYTVNVQRQSTMQSTNRKQERFHYTWDVSFLPDPPVPHKSRP